MKASHMPKFLKTIASNLSTAKRTSMGVAASIVFLVAPGHAFAQSANFNFSALDNLMCTLYSYLSTKMLFYVALIVAIVGILAYLLKMNKEIWGTLFVIALLVGVVQGLGGALSSLGSFNVQCSAIL